MQGRDNRGEADNKYHDGGLLLAKLSQDQVRKALVVIVILPLRAVLGARQIPWRTSSQ